MRAANGGPGRRRLGANTPRGARGRRKGAAEQGVGPRGSGRREGEARVNHHLPGVWERATGDRSEERGPRRKRNSFPAAPRCAASPGTEHREPGRTRSCSPTGAPPVTPEAAARVTAQLTTAILRRLFHKLTRTGGQEGSERPRQ